MLWETFARQLSVVQARGDLTRAEYLELAASQDARSRATARHAKNGPAWLPATFGTQANVHGNFRWNENVLAVTALVIDVDNAKPARKTLTPAELLSDLPTEWAVGWHTTFAHRPERPRFRVVIPWRVPVSAMQHRQAFQAVQGRFSDRLDPVSAAPAAIYFLPSCPPDSTADFRSGMQGERFASFDEVIRAWSR
jgi:hypothetical protein